MRVVLDTNVLVSGLLNPHGSPGRIMDLLLAGGIQVLYDDRILAEYLDVLARPQLEIDSSLAQAVVSYIRLSGERITAPPLIGETLPDPDDLPFAEIAVAGKADTLVTGNTKHFSKLKGATVLSPTQFLKQLA